MSQSLVSISAQIRNLDLKSSESSAAAEDIRNLVENVLGEIDTQVNAGKRYLLGGGRNGCINPFGGRYCGEKA